jgi:outer membrane biosynthesis protein TonB
VNDGSKSDVTHSFNLNGQEAVNQQFKEQESTNNIYEQKIFSADQLGDLTLSTYSWEWAPYINALKRKLHQVWFTPPAYYQLGLIHGYTTIRFSISKSGDLIEYAVLEHKGHESLEQSSINAIKSSFPFKSLPARFPDEKLTITARLIYPNLRERIH